MALELKNLTLGYKGSEHLIRDLNISVPEGEMIALLGRNGVGKSTLLRSLAGVVPPLEGDVLLDGQSLFDMSSRELAEKVAFVSTETVSVTHLRVWDVVSLGRSPYTGWMGTLSKEDRKVVSESLRLVGMERFVNTPVDRLSDGERQRVMIARALAQDTAVVLLDEPTAFLDLPNRYQIAMLLRELAHQTGKSILFSTHDMATSVQLCDALWVMSPQGLSFGAPEDLVSSGALDVLFAGTKLALDRDSAAIRIEQHKVAYVRLGGDTSDLLLRALERCRIGIDSQAKDSVVADRGEYIFNQERVSDLYTLCKRLSKLSID